MANRQATDAMLGALFKGVGRRGAMGNVGGMSGGGASGMRGMGGGGAALPKVGFGGDPMLNPNAVINAPDRQLNAYIDDKMQQWLPTSQQKQDKLDTELYAKMLPQMAGQITPELIQGLQQQAAQGGMSPQGQINMLGGAYGLLDAQRQRDMQAQQNALTLKKLEAQIENVNARTEKTKSGGSGKSKKGDDELILPGGGGAY